MLGAPVTVKLTPLLDTPPEVVTTTFPVVAPVGTNAVMLPACQLLVVAAVPLNFTVPRLLPKFEPAITIEELMAPLFGVRLVMLGAVPPPEVVADALLATSAQLAELACVIGALVAVAEVCIQYSVPIP
jgi:hypothetical protein